MRATPIPAPTPMPILALLESPEFGLFELGESVCEEPVESVCDDPVFDTPRDVAPDAGVAVGVNATPIFCAREVAYAMGNRERSLASHATWLSHSILSIGRLLLVHRRRMRRRWCMLWCIVREREGVLI
jgi:hypothetical protein